MKLSIAQILLSIAVALPLSMVSFMIANPVNAEQISRNKSIDDEITSVTELNLAIPGERSTPNSSRKNLPTTDSSSSKVLTNKQSKKVESKSKSNTKIATTLNTSTSVTPTIHSTSKRKIATNSPPPFAGNYLRLVRDPNKEINSQGNPIYTLEAYVNGRKYRSFKAVTGTANSQTRDRNIGSNFAPLPDGLYRVSNSIVPGTIPQVGKTFIGIYPRFETNRTDLGIHQDPGFDRPGFVDGTAGCIGLVSDADRDAVNSFVSKYQPHNLIVKIAPKV